MTLPVPIAACEQLDPTGSARWPIPLHLGGYGNDVGNESIAVDGQGNGYLTGYTYRTIIHHSQRLPTLLCGCFLPMTMPS